MRGWEATNPLHRREPCVFGLRLVPVTLGHLFLLHDCGVEIEEMDKPEPLMLAVFICSQRHGQSRRDMGRFWFNFFLFLWGMKCRKMNLKMELSVFQKWFFDQIKGPITKSKNPGSGDDHAAPLHFTLLAIAESKLNRPKPVAMDSTVSELRKLIVALGESEGVIHPWTKQDERLDDYAEQVKQWEAANAITARN